VLAASTSARTLVYDYSGMRQRSGTIAGETTSYDFDAGGRLSETLLAGSLSVMVGLFVTPGPASPSAPRAWLPRPV